VVLCVVLYVMMYVLLYVLLSAAADAGDAASAADAGVLILLSFDIFRMLPHVLTRGS
jgi:hypothetical protein